MHVPCARDIIRFWILPLAVVLTMLHVHGQKENLSDTGLKVSANSRQMLN